MAMLVGTVDVLNLVLVKKNNENASNQEQKQENEEGKTDFKIES